MFLLNLLTYRQLENRPKEAVSESCIPVHYNCVSIRPFNTTAASLVAIYSKNEDRILSSTLIIHLDAHVKYSDNVSGVDLLSPYLPLQLHSGTTGSRSKTSYNLTHTYSLSSVYVFF